MEKKIIMKWSVLVFFPVFALLLAAAGASAESLFRQEFTESYMSQKFDYMAILIRKNSATVPGEAKAIVDEALSGEKSYDEKMRLIDIAHAMASMHRHWNGDPETLALVEKVRDEEMKKERDLQAELHKWDQYEKFLGNFVMKDSKAEMDSKELAPVVYPHWMHRLWFECKTCHQSIFKMKRGANGISHKKMAGGGQCAACHNGKKSFSTDADCEKCHLAGKPAGEHLRDVKKVDFKWINDVSARVGASWNAEDIPGKSIPLDRYGFVDWVFLNKVKSIERIKSLENDFKDEVRDDVILFESKMPGIKSVAFSHTTHSSRVKCDTCHQMIFKDKLGENKVTMMEMAEGKVCGYCHGKVAFNFADCNRCHEIPQGERPQGAIVRNSQATQDTQAVQNEQAR